MNIYFTVDRSGSMNSKWDETIGAINAYVSKLINDKLQDVKITVAFFDSGDSLEITRRNITLENWTDMKTEDVTPRGMTPLHDAILRTNELIKSDSPQMASVVIITDGLENCSQEGTAETTKQIVSTLEKQEFDINFLGADFNVVSESKDMGWVNKDKVINMKKGNYDQTFMMIATNAVLYNKTRSSVKSFSDHDRALASGSTSE